MNRRFEQAGDSAEVLEQVMRDKLGFDAVGIAAVWAGLRREPALPPGAKAIYLDHLHWVNLAKARVGRDDGQSFVRCLELLVSAVAAGRVVLPLSSTHYSEVGQTGSIRQRSDVTNVMAELSHFTTLAVRSVRLECEFDAALHARFGRPAFPRILRPFGTGIAFAFGLGDGPMGHIDYTGPADHVPGELRLRRMRELEHRMNQTAEYLFLRGPSPEEFAFMPGYDIGLVKEIADSRAAREQQVMDLLKELPEKVAQLGDIVTGRSVYWDIGEKLVELCARANLSVESFFDRGKDWITAFIEDLPAIRVAKTLTMQTDKNGTRAWKRNDIHDMDALSGAVPYCDIVVTDKHACEVMNRSGLAEMYGTVVIRSLAELEPVLERMLVTES